MDTSLNTLPPLPTSTTTLPDPNTLTPIPTISPEVTFAAERPIPPGEKTNLTTLPATESAAPLVEGREGRRGLSAVELGVITVAIAISIVLIGIILALQRPLA
jgi:hypothetical protein